MLDSFHKGISGGLKCSPFSLFDLCVASVLYAPFIHGNFNQSIYLIFSMIFVICLTVGMKPKRDYRSLPLSLLTLFSFLGIFLHSTSVVKLPVANAYINASLMFEGFIYIFIGSLFLKSVVNYSKNITFIWALVPVAMIPWIKMMIIGRVTVVAALVLSTMIYMIIKKKYIIPVLLSICGIAFTVVNWDWLSMKFFCRPYIWGQLVSDIIKHPFVGEGFCKYLWGNMTWAVHGGVVYGWIYRHNDYLGLGAYLGIPSMVCVIWFVVNTIKRIGVRILLIPFLTIAIACCFQMIMFFPDKGAICLMVMALCLTGTYKEERDVKKNSNGFTRSLFYGINSILLR